ncbi:hypothetical protein PVK06_048872 [Gossypium arboreum]|uniref:Uncharacterized protein n=1 Tax=Gossypium arboreum TaxID=29729 RepID=A0ABR0MHN1_GOSAR|nr:hypothetical protein PVK06_048872 [Gossypium arboreum]
MTVFLNLDKLLLPHILVNETIRVKYEALPLVCFGCNRYGHLKTLYPYSESLGVQLMEKEVTLVESAKGKEEETFGPWMPKVEAKKGHDFKAAAATPRLRGPSIGVSVGPDLSNVVPYLNGLLINKMGSKIPTGSNQNGKIHLAAESTAINFDNSNNVVPSMEVVLENWEKEVQVLRGSGSKGMSIKSERNLNRTIKGHGGHFKVAGNSQVPLADAIIIHG